MEHITGTLIWDTSVPQHCGWWLRSHAVNDGTPALPSQPCQKTAFSADYKAIWALVYTTLQVYGYRTVTRIRLGRKRGGGYGWSAWVARDVPQKNSCVSSLNNVH